MAAPLKFLCSLVGAIVLLASALITPALAQAPQPAYVDSPTVGQIGIYTGKQKIGSIPLDGTTVGIVDGKVGVIGQMGLPAASTADTSAGTASNESVTPSGLMHSNVGKRVIQVLVTDPNGAPLSTGTGQAYFRVGPEMTGMNLVGVAATVVTPSTSGNPTVQLTRMRSGVNTPMLSTQVSIDANQNDSSTATTAAVIDSTADDVATADLIRVDCTGAGNNAYGLIISLTFSLP